MASERQIAANRRNALKSTGPRSHGGKRRVARNAYKHGLAATVASETSMQAVDNLARKILACNGRGLAFKHARSVAEASHHLAHVRLVKVSLIEHVAASLQEPLLGADPV